jgi:hypothetical protein
LSVWEVQIICEQYHGCIANVTEVIKHDCTQTEITRDRLNRSSLNKYVHAAKVITNSPIYIEMLRSQIVRVHRKISSLNFGTNLVQFCCLYGTIPTLTIEKLARQAGG